MRRLLTIGIAATLLIAFASVKAADLDPKAIKITPAKDIKWTATGQGSEQAIIMGDPAKTGMYIVLTKWLPHQNSRPHSHPNDRYITVLKGTWWVDTGSTYKPEDLKPVPEGSHVIHYGGQMHYDGAKDQEVILEIVGMGPAR